MNAIQSVFMQPQDVLTLRGNKLFGDAGSYGESLIPPWPSVAAGALRSRMLADGTLTGDALTDPAHFTLTGFHLARRNAHGQVERLYALPADLIVKEENGAPALRAMEPHTLAPTIACSGSLPQLPVLAEGRTRQKASPGWWLTEGGWQAYLAGQLPSPEHLIHSRELWKLEARIGVGLDKATGRADDGKLFTTQVVALRKGCDATVTTDVGFVASARCAKFPQSGLVRFGGDGHAAALYASEVPQAPLPGVAIGGRFKLVLTTPGLFPDGWRLPGVDDNNLWHGPDGCTARLVCAAVPRAEVVSGWDLKAWAPKPAQRFAPIGSVYWLEGFEGEPAALQKLSANGLWHLQNDNDDPQRRAEGFNRCALGCWS